MPTPIKLYNWPKWGLRAVHPIPTSPQLSPGQDPSTLVLVPVNGFSKYLADAFTKLQSTLGCEMGSYAEFGVYNGTSMIAAYQASKATLRNPLKLFGFDSFEGLPEESAREDAGVWRPGQFRCPRDVAENRLISGGVPESQFNLIAGWYKDTLAGPSPFIMPNEVSVVLIDCDTYSSAKLALNYVAPYLTSRAVIVFDDWKLNNLDILELGEWKAFKEFRTEHPEFSVRRLRGYSRKSVAFWMTRTQP